MHVDVRIASVDGGGRVFLTWTPVQATLRLVDGTPGRAVPVTVRSAGRTGRLLFDLSRGQPGASSLSLPLPGDGSPVAVWIAGEFGHPSVQNGDAAVTVTEDATGAELASVGLMVRVRKNANLLTPAERDRFLAAFGTLNGQGTGRFVDFRDMHTSAGYYEAHGSYGFLAWHRAYLLDLERELQAIDASVALPYWRFDQPAPNVFSPDFMGVPNASGRVLFSPGHPFQFWVAGSTPGVSRPMSFRPDAAPRGLLDERATLAIAGSYDGFSQMEGDPHGLAHTSFGGPIRDPTTAAQDPLFFLLHGNVDRLWAKWQWLYRHGTESDPDAYANQGGPWRVGHNLADTMWPWNGAVVRPRPPVAPGGALAASALTSVPGPSPAVRAMIDYQGLAGGGAHGFDYDDVPFELPPVAVAGAGDQGARG